MKKNLAIIITILILSNSYSQCKDIFIGNLYQFKNNDLFLAKILDNNSSDYYIDIFFKDEFDKNNLDLKTIDDFENSRQTIKKEIAIKAFNLKGLDTIYFYSNSNELIGYGIYKQSEYYENMIESRYIATYTPYLYDSSQKPYYASNCKTSHRNTKWIESANNVLENKILNTYKINKSSIIKVSHFTDSNSTTTYSIISYSLPDLNSIIVKYQNEKLTKIYETGSDYILDDMFISSFEYNNNPIIITELTLPESDYFDNAPIFYNGEEYSFKKGDRSDTENAKGDFNGDGITEYIFIEKPTFADEYGECIGNCNCYLKFTNENITPIKIENCIGGIPENLDDLNNNGNDEIGIQVNWWSPLGGRYQVFTFKNGEWKYLVDPISTHCYSCPENYKPIEKDPDIEGNVIIRYTEMLQDGEFTLKSKSIKVD
ncbi:hypothetical protein [Confluentibacter lentus]|uniref:hypothetical protein n=1 Tax=Confluentibacter lentus TaxID=1699412 RepID=UPI000C28D472|nr:hypothetical protein [Confluentibacter lentus]